MRLLKGSLGGFLGITFGLALFSILAGKEPLVLVKPLINALKQWDPLTTRMDYYAMVDRWFTVFDPITQRVDVCPPPMIDGQVAKCTDLPIAIHSGYTTLYSGVVAIFFLGVHLLSTCMLAAISLIYVVAMTSSYLLSLVVCGLQWWNEPK